jgi:rifampicin phosphotransferase
MGVHFKIVTQIGEKKLGGKAEKLFELKQKGFQVPPLVVIPASALIAFLENNNNEITCIPTIEWAQTFIDEIVALLPNENYAVRSSAMHEDGISNSFAGQYETVLQVSKNELGDAIKKVWLSVYSERVKTYKAQQQIITDNSISIIIQSMLESKIAGVAFGIHPLTGNANEFVINAVLGLGEALVSGEINSDSYTIHQDNSITFALAIRNKAVLNEVQILEVKTLLQKVNAYYNYPQDIEFAYDDNHQLFLLQSRPVTSAFGSTLTVYDNSNIIESYPGLTSPLTYSFIEKMYASVYQQLSALLGVSDKKIEQHTEMFNHMLGHIKGRVYYNLNNWYKALSLIPGYQLNARFMEKMMGVKERFDIQISEKETKWREIINVLRAIVHVIKTHNNINKERTTFRQHFETISNQYNALDFDALSLDELVEHYITYEQTLVKQWNAPLINDFFAMIYFGLLQKQVEKNKLGDQLYNSLLAGSNDIISLEPANWCIEMSQLILANETLKLIFIRKSVDSIWKIVNDNTYTELSQRFNAYIKKWGVRSVGELKLETITHQDDPKSFIKILKQYVIQGIDKKQHAQSHIQKMRSDAESIVNHKLKGVKKKIFYFILNKTRDLVSNRESLRFERTKAFNTVRQLFLAMDRQLYSQKILKLERAIFWLQQTEVYDLIKNRSDVKYIEKYQTLISERQKQYSIWEKEIVPERIMTYSDVQKHYFTKEKEADILNADLKGIGCCAGIVRAEIVVMRRPDEISDLKGAILVTSSTDPGWITLFPTAGGILVERGSLLSHSAIVSREMGIPCVVGISNLLQKLNSGDIVEMDGSTGLIKLIQKKD